MNTSVLIGIMIPFIGTTLGAACVFFMKQKMDNRVQKVLLGFASGVMIAASVWSLLIPALDIDEYMKIGYITHKNIPITHYARDYISHLKKHISFSI